MNPLIFFLLFFFFQKGKQPVRGGFEDEMGASSSMGGIGVSFPASSVYIADVSFIR